MEVLGRRACVGKRMGWLFAAFAGTTAISPVFAAGGVTEDLADIYGSAEFVTIATGKRQPITMAPAVTTVITAADIEALGASDLDQVLETIPGMHVSYYATAYNPIYVLRGIHSDTNPHLLMLINGVPITSVFYGDRGRVWGGMPVKAIARIEVIRGPGSALYGADAFSGVVNIVTKDRHAIDGQRLGASAGSFNTQRAWWSAGGEVAGMDAAMTLEVGTTDGQRERIDADAQSGLDALLHSIDSSIAPVSLAPGPVNTGRDNIDARFELGRGKWTMRAGYQGRYHVESGAGAAGALDPSSEYRSERINADVTYRDAQWSKDWDVSLRTSVFFADQRNQSPFVLFPPGVDFSVLGGGSFPQGAIGSPDIAERHGRIDASAVYGGWTNHDLRIGTGYEYADLYHVGEVKNFSLGAGGVVNALPGGLTDVSNDASSVFLPERSRTLRYVYVQDAWGFATGWDLTLGARYDRYSDFGGTINPRASLVHAIDYETTAKLLYGRAFRAPAFAELYSQNNPVTHGNADLKPEVIDTLELVWDYRPADVWRGSVNVFGYRARDMIGHEADPAPATSTTMRNVGRLRGRGIEFESRWTPTAEWKVDGNVALVNVIDSATSEDAGDAPERHAFLNAQRRVAPMWSVGSQVNWVAKRRRELGDGRPAVNDYALVDVGARREAKGADGWAVTLAIRNLFDKRAYEPVAATLGIPDDLPLAGRSVMVAAEYAFDQRK